MSTALQFRLPSRMEAKEPPEERGVPRDQVRLLVARPGQLQHASFSDLGKFLDPGDLVVVNTSATLPAAVDGQRADGTPVAVHFATPEDGGGWVVEVRPPGVSHGAIADARAGERIDLPGGGFLTLRRPFAPRLTVRPRLWAADLSVGDDVVTFLHRHGRPITYAYVPGRWPLSAYQTVFAREDGSAEMASAGRPFTPELVTSLVVAGVVLAPITLHAGVSSSEMGEPPIRERYVVPAATADLVNLTREMGRRVVAVGTTVTRALETVADRQGVVIAGAGWTDLLLGPQRPARVVNGLVTGWHAPGASHLSLLEAVAGRDLVQTAYDEAVRAGYLWHEFGDTCLLLPAVSRQG